LIRAVARPPSTGLLCSIGRSRPLSSLDCRQPACSRPISPGSPQRRRDVEREMYSDRTFQCRTPGLPEVVKSRSRSYGVVHVGGPNGSSSFAPLEMPGCPRIGIDEWNHRHLDSANVPGYSDLPTKWNLVLRSPPSKIVISFPLSFTSFRGRLGQTVVKAPFHPFQAST
jgi:hypothetical protein